MNFSTYLNVKSVGWSYLAPSGAFFIVRTIMFYEVIVNKINKWHHDK